MVYKYFIKIIIIAIYFFTVFDAFSEYRNTHLDSVVLSFDDAIRYTTLNNADILGAKSLLKIAKYKTNSSFGSLFPQVYVGAGFKRGDDGKSSMFNNLFSIVKQNNIQNNYSAEVSVSQNIFSGGSIIQKIRSLMYAEDGINYDLKITKANISFKLKSAFINLNYANDYLNLAYEILKRRKENLSLISLRYKNGLENKGSVMLAEAYLNEAEFDILKAINSISVSKKHLAEVIGFDGDENILNIIGDIPLSSPEKIDIKDIATQTPIYLKALANEKKAKAEKYESIGKFMPSINLFVNAGKSDNTIHMKNSNWAVGINAKMPIFTGGSNYYLYKASNENYKHATNNTISVLRNIISDIEEKYSLYIESIEKLKVDKNYLDAEKTRAKISRQKYNNGLTSFEDWDRIENSLITKQKHYIESKRNRVIAEARFEEVLGIGVIE